MNLEFRSFGDAIRAAAIVLALASTAEAFSGRLVDKRTGRPVSGALVSIDGQSGAVRSDADGRFVWMPDPAPPFDVIIVLAGGRLARPARVAAGADLAHLVIAVDAAVDERLVVSGAAPSVEAWRGLPADVVSSADIGTRAPANLIRALENIVGVSGAAEGQSAVPAIRGLARGRTLVLVDGGRLFSERRAGPSVSFLAPESAERIEVVRGPASVAYGSDAFGGVISVITRSPAIGAPPSGRFAGAWGAGVPARRGDAQLSVPVGGRAALLGAARYREAGDYRSPDGVVPNSAWRDRGGLVRAMANVGGWWRAGWQGDFVAASGLPRSDSSTLLVSSPFERSQRLSLAFERTGVRWLDQLSASAGWSTYEQRIDQDRLAAPGRTRRIDRADIGGTDLQFRAVAETGLGATSRLTSGVDFNERRGVTAHDVGITFNTAGAITGTADSASIADARKRTLGAFAQTDIALRSRLTLTAGARLDHAENVNTGGYFGDRAVSHAAVSGSVALSFRPWPALTTSAQLSRGFHDPSLSDRFYRGPAGRGFIIGNPDLLPERSTQVDLSARLVAGRWRASISAYRYDITDLIERYQSGTDTFLFRNRGLAELRGAESEVSFEARKGLTVRLDGQLTRGRARDDGAALDDTAPRSMRLQVQQVVNARGFFSVRVAAVGADNAPGPSEVASPGYVDIGGTASWRFSRALSLTLVGANLLNAPAHSSASPRWVLAPGRNFTLAAAVAF